MGLNKHMALPKRCHVLQSTMGTRCVTKDNIKSGSSSDIDKKFLHIDPTGRAKQVVTFGNLHAHCSVSIPYQISSEINTHTLSTSCSVTNPIESTVSTTEGLQCRRMIRACRCEKKDGNIEIETLFYVKVKEVFS